MSGQSKSKSYRIKLLLLFVTALFAFAAEVSAKTSNPQTPNEENRQYNDETGHQEKKKGETYDQRTQADTQPGTGRGSQFTYGGPGNQSESPVQQAQMTIPDGGGSGGGGGSLGGQTRMYEPTAKLVHPPRDFQWSKEETQYGAEAGTTNLKMTQQQVSKPFHAGAIPSYNYLMAGPYVFSGFDTAGHPGRPISNVAAGTNDARAAQMGAQDGGNPKGQCSGSKCNGSGNQASSAGSAGEDTLECMQNALDGMTLNLINVANEDAGSPCSSDQVSKTYANAVWMVMKMYKACFIPMGVLFLLPGALITNTKTLVSFGILHNGNDEDCTNPFAGIMRSTIAIFLIPATQMILSYMVDVGNSLQYSCQPYVNIPIIVLWAQEQVQIFKPDQQGGPIANLPNIPMAPWRGKFAGMPKAGAILEQISGLDAALSELANECCHILTEGLTIAYAFQLATLCYLFLLGPIAAAFFAWPSGIGKDIFRKAFSSWVDGVVLVSLWKFWWNVLLICMTVRCESGALNPFDVFEVYYLVAFLCIMMVVPFNPFDFKPGEIVSKALEKAQAVASKVAEAGKAGGSGKGGKSSPGAG